MEMDPAKGQFLVYRAEDGKLKLDVRLEDENIWLTQAHMVDLFQTTKQNISLHIQNIYEEGELAPEATVKKYLTVRREGSREVNRLLDYYNLDMIISVGYRVKSHVATRFRIWATQKLTEFIIKGFVLDSDGLPVGFPDEISSGEGGYQHQQGGFGKVKVGRQLIHRISQSRSIVIEEQPKRGSTMDEPKSLDSLFKEKIFRIPDYQRGYAWQKKQLKDFREDLRRFVGQKIDAFYSVPLEVECFSR